MKLRLVETDVLPMPVTDTTLKIAGDQTVYSHTETVLPMLIVAGLQLELFDVLLLDRSALRVHGELDAVQRVVQQNEVRIEPSAILVGVFGTIFGRIQTKKLRRLIGRAMNFWIQRDRPFGRTAHRSSKLYRKFSIETMIWLQGTMLMFSRSPFTRSRLILCAVLKPIS